MKSITYKLAIIFLAISLIPLIIGTAGSVAQQNAKDALTNSAKSLNNLSGLLTAVGETINANAKLQNDAYAAANKIVSAQSDTYTSIKNMSEILLPRTFVIARMRFALLDVASAERALLLTLNMRHLEQGELQETKDNQTRIISEAMETLNSSRQTYPSLIQSEEELSAWQNLEKNLDAWQENHDLFMGEIVKLEELLGDLIRGGPVFVSAVRKAYDTAFVAGKATREACENSLGVLNDAIAMTAESNVNQALESQNQSNELIDSLDKDFRIASERANDLRDQIEYVRSATTAATEQAASELSSSARRFWFLLIVSVIGVIVAVVFGIAFSIKISTPVRSMANHMSRLAIGDLRADVPEKDLKRCDEIGQLAQAMQDMISSNRREINMANAMANGDYTLLMPVRSESDDLGRALSKMLINSNNTLSEFSKAIDRVSSGAMTVSDASSSLSKGAQTSAAALEEITVSVSHVDGQAHENADNATKANQLATGSRDAARRGYNAVTELVVAMGEIQDAGKKIASVAKLIDDIAFQTNLLALNAAVEAARAGLHGKGFSVVAEEVRNLSGRSARAAKETSAMVEAMGAKVDAGAVLATKTDQELREIVKATMQVAQHFEDITSASNEQSLAIAEISRGLEQIDVTIQSTSQNADNTAHSAQELSKQAEELRRMVSRFKLLPKSSIDRGARVLTSSAPEKALPFHKE